VGDVMTLSSLTQATDLLAAVSFAVTGSLVASRKKMDIIGFMWLAVLTGVGGGTVRDMILDVPVFWVLDPIHLVACLVTAVFVFFLVPFIESRRQAVLWFDAIGLALVTVVGTAKGMDHGVGPFVAVVMGVITATVGGVVRDVIGNEPSVILRREIYVTAALLGGSTYVLLFSLDVSGMMAAIASFLVTFTVRSVAMIFQWQLPSFPGSDRSSDDQAAR